MRRLIKSHYFRPAIVGVLCLLATWAAVTIAMKTERQAALLTFEDLVDNVNSTVDEKFASFLTVLQSSAAFYAADPKLDPSDWLRFARILKRSQPVEGAQRIGLALFVEEQDRKSFETTMSQFYNQGFRIWPPNSQALNIIVIASDDNSPKAPIGWNLASEPSRLAVLQKMMTTRTAQMTPPLTLVDEQENKPGVLVLYPVTSEADDRDLIGITVMAMRLDKLMAAVIADSKHELYLHMRDAAGNLIYSNVDRTVFEKHDVLRATHEMDVFGQKLTLNWSKPAPWQDIYLERPLVPMIAASGIFLAIILFNLIGSVETTRSRAEKLARDRTEELNGRENFLRSLLNSAHQMILWTDQAGRVIGINKAVEEQLGYEEGELTGSVPSELFVNCTNLRDKATQLGQPNLKAMEVFQLLAKSERVFSNTCTLTRRDQTSFPVLTTVSTLQDLGEEVTGYLLIMQDMSRQQEDNDRLIEAKDEAVAANKSKDEFLANISHELRTPLNGILGMAELLKDHSMTAEATESVDLIHQSGQFLLTLINDLLDFEKLRARAVTIEKRPFHLADEMKGAIALVFPKAQQKAILVSLDLDPRLPEYIVGDSLRLRQIIQNLLSNAVKFTDQGGVTLSVRALFDAPSSEQQNLRLKFSVEDTGIGIEGEQRQKIFKAFQQADISTTRLYGGTGLGLSICSELVSLMGGTITLLSTPGQGSTFSFEITAQGSAAPKPAAEASSTLEPKAAAINKPRILLAEDNDINVHYMERLLTKWGYDFVTVKNGLVAQQQYSQAAFDVALLDLQMPGADGYAVAKYIRDGENQAKPCTIVAITAHAQEKDKLTCLNGNFDHYIAKPIRSSKLKEILESVVASSPVHLKMFS